MLAFTICDLRANQFSGALLLYERVNRKSQIVNSNSFFFRGPPLSHQLQQMLKRFIVRAVLFRRQLLRAFVQLRRHLGGFFLRAAQRYQNSGEFGDFHGTN